MGLRVIGSGLGRTGTTSLKLALERLLGERCYHMTEVREAGHVDRWRRAALGQPTDWDDLFADFGAVVDWPAAPFWPELAEQYPEAVILHSSRRDTETWQRSAERTIFQSPNHADHEFEAMWSAVAGLTFEGSYLDREVTMAGYERHNEHVMATAPRARLVVYQPGDGWAPLCDALGLPEPDEPFPHENTTAQFRNRGGLDAD